MPTLFLLSHAPHTDPAEGKRLELARPADSVVLTEDATYAAGALTTPFSAPLQEAATRGVTIYALSADLDARGIATTFPQVDYDGLVDLITSHDRVVH
jgi:sulfur relay protein TusB/DsrH